MAAPAKFLFDMDFSAPDKRERQASPSEIAQRIASAEARAYRDGYEAGLADAAKQRLAGAAEQCYAKGYADSIDRTDQKRKSYRVGVDKPGQSITDGGKEVGSGKK